MSILAHFETVFDSRGIALDELTKLSGIQGADLERVRNGNFKAIRLSTLDALCKVLSCQPGDVFSYINEEEVASTSLPKQQ